MRWFIALVLSVIPSVASANSFDFTFCHGDLPPGCFSWASSDVARGFFTVGQAVYSFGGPIDTLPIAPHDTVGFNCITPLYCDAESDYGGTFTQAFEANGTFIPGFYTATGMNNADDPTLLITDPPTGTPELGTLGYILSGLMLVYIARKRAR